jgi:hypothetical protein
MLVYFCGHLVYIIHGYLVYFFPVLVCYTTKKVATLAPPVIDVLHDLLDGLSGEVRLKDGAVEDQVEPLTLVPHFGVLVLEVDDAMLQ